MTGGPDIFAGQPTDPDLLAEIYDVEHDQIVEDLAFYRELTRRAGGGVLDLGCGSGRLFATFLAGGAPRVVGVDGSPALLRRARRRIRRSSTLSAALEEGHLQLVEADVTELRRSDRFSLVVAVGVVPHLSGPAAALKLLQVARRRLTAAGRLVIDDLGPGMLPDGDLPLSVDWRRRLRGRPLVRYSQLMREERADGLHVAFSTLVERTQPDGTIARLPASHRLWYPSSDGLERLVRQAGMTVELIYGSHDLEPLNRDSERLIVVARRPRMDERERSGRSRSIALQAG
ncbi:MAG TPA: class I SAM-dependent methyltransferase [Candidatus Limnocylindria bacterium]|nr:class I SAM-dependent methyltransferase [Candidatus Limnocylindria bacterium]